MWTGGERGEEETKERQEERRGGGEDSVLMSFSHDFRKRRNPPRFKDLKRFKEQSEIEGGWKECEV